MPELPAWLVRRSGIFLGDTMIEFKGKQYELKPLFIRQEAALAKQWQRLKDPDFEVRADAMIEVARIYTGIDIGDLNGSSLEEVRQLNAQIALERKRLAPDVAEAAPEAPEEGKA